MSTFEDHPTSESSPAVAKTLNPLRVITLALFLGAVSVLGLGFFLSGEDMTNEPDIISYVGLGSGAFLFLLHLVIPNLIVKTSLSKQQGSLQDADPEAAYYAIGQVFSIQHIFGTAMLEGAAMFNSICFLLHSFIGNAIFAGMMAIVIAFRLATLSGAPRWIDEKYQQMS